MAVAADAESAGRAGPRPRPRARARGERRPGLVPVRRRLRDAGLGVPEAARGLRRPVVPARVGRAGPPGPLLVPRLPAAARAALGGRRADRDPRRRGRQERRSPIPTALTAEILGRYGVAEPERLPAVRGRRGRLLRLRPGAHRRAARRAEPRPARAARPGADGLRADARLRPPAARGHRPGLRVRRGRRDRHRLRPRARRDRRGARRAARPGPAATPATGQSRRANGRRT